MERYLDNPDIRRAAAIISGAKAEAAKISPGNDHESLERRHRLTSEIINQILERNNHNNGQPKPDSQALEQT